MTSNEKELAAFIAHKAKLDNALERLQALSDDHFNLNPDDVKWGHVGDLVDLAALLIEATNRAFKEGEYAR